VKFLARGNGYTLVLTATEAVLSVNNPGSRNKKEEGRSSVVHMKLVGANPAAKGEALEELPGKSNYFIGNDPAKWRTNVPTYAKVRYGNVYSGVDLVYYGNQGQLEHDFLVAPGADPQAIRLSFSGANKLTLDAGGNLLLHTAAGRVQLYKPFVYQEVNGVRREVSARYVLEGNCRTSFRLGAYDRSRTLVIDPVLVYSTYADAISGLAVDAAGNAYLVGGDRVKKLNPSGSALVYSTFLDVTDASAIAVDRFGNAYVTGTGPSATFPVTPGAFRTSRGNAFLARLNPSGNSLVYATYLELGLNGRPAALAVDLSGNAYFAGVTALKAFPATPGAFQVECPSGLCAFVAKFNSNGSALVYATYFDDATDIAVDSSGNAYITGTTGSSSFPTTIGSFRPTLPGGGVFVTKFSPVGNTLIYSTYLGNGIGSGIAVDSSGSAYVTGRTSTSFPTVNAFQATLRGIANAFVAKLNPAGSALVYSTYLGGNVGESGSRIAVDAAGNAYVTGDSASTTFPTTPDALQLAFGGGNRDSFIAQLSSAGTALLYSTYLGGRNDETPAGIAVDSIGNLYVAGWTNSNNFPTANALQATPSGSISGYIVKIATRSGAPTINSDGIVNGASFAKQGLAGGGLASLFGTNLASRTATASAVPLATTLAGVTVQVHGFNAPLFFVSPSQINFQIPWEVLGLSQASLTVTVEGLSSSPQVVAMGVSAPGLFATNSSGSGQGAILIADTGEIAGPVGSIPGRAARPVRRGAFVSIYCTGLGLVNNRPDSGGAGSGNPLSTTVAVPTVTIGGVSAPVSFAGLAPGFVGLYQVNVQVPDGTPTGDAVPVVLAIGGVTSNAVTIATQ